MRAAVVSPEPQLTLQDVPDPPDDGRALVAVRRAGVCGTDVKIATGAIPLKRPTILGHEIVGTIVREGRRGLVPKGQRVLIDPVTFCAHCDRCRADLTHLCRNGGLMGRDEDGGFAELMAVDELQLHPLPDSLPDDEALLTQVAGTCLHAQTLVNVFPGDTAVVVGLGVSGLLHVQLLRARGVKSVIGVTRSAWKRDMAMELGATATAHPNDAADLVAEVTGGRGADLTVEAAGNIDTLRQSIDLAGPGATVLGFGLITATEGELPFYQFYLKELNLVNARAARPRDYARTIELTAAG
ncbi:MAG: alcohol dehydrogenase catalytic domain-containing protein, partial [Dehalococcoidia bacterium]